MEKHFKLISGLLAFLIYFTLLGLLINYFNHHTRRKSIHFVEKNDNRITVSISDSSPKTTPAKKSSKPKAKAKPKHKLKPKYKKEKKTVPEKKKIKEAKKEKSIPSKSEKKKENKKKEKKIEKKKVNVGNLFQEVKEKKPVEKKKKKVTKHAEKSSKKRDRGIENAYFAKVENILYNWPAQSEFAGETIKVWLSIRQDGSFTFRVLSASNNDAFNNELINYLKQLQKIGFGRHQNSKPYELNVEFVAKE